MTAGSPRGAVKPAVLSVGVPIVDHVFEEHGDYIGSSPIGGSALNVLANCSNDVDRLHAGSIADDALGRTALGACQSVGIRSFAAVRPRSETFQIFQQLAIQKPLPMATLSETLHTFSGTCPLCGSRPCDQRGVVSSVRATEVDGDLLTAHPGTVVFLDRVNQGSQRVAAAAKAAGCTTVVDIGRLEFIRFLPTAKLIAFVRHVDVLFASSATLRSIVRRSGLEAPLDLLNAGPRVVVELMGPAGYVCHHRLAGPSQSSHFDPVRVPAVVDDAGAGDSLISGLCERLALDAGVVTAEAVQDGLDLGRDRVARCLESLGAVGHVGAGLVHIDVAAHAPSTRCSVCQSPLQGAGSRVAQAAVTPRKRSRSRDNVRQMMDRSLFAAESLDARQLREFLDKPSSSPLVVVGTGGSTAAAEFVADVARREFHRFAMALKPRDYLVSGIRGADVLGISYSGTSADVQQALHYAEKVGDPTALLTGGSPDRIRRGSYGGLLFPYGAPRRRSERGFLSFSGTVAPCVATLFAVRGPSALADLAARVDNSAQQEWTDLGRAIGLDLAQGRVLHLLHAGELRAAAVDLESKMVESGLGRIVVHELKDFTHGRFMSVDVNVASAPPTVLMLATRRGHRYVDALSRALEAPSIHLHNVRFDAGNSVDALVGLCAIQFIFLGIAEAFGLDPSRPAHLDERFLRLYRRTSNPAE